jgi:internalin A
MRFSKRRNHALGLLWTPRRPRWTLCVMDAPDKRSWRRYRHVSLRSSLGLVLLFGVLLGWIVHRAEVQRTAVAAIRRAGGTVLYEWEIKNGTPISNARPWWPQWLVALIGVDYFGDVVAFWGGRRFSDVELSQVVNLGRLERVNLNASSVTDAGLVHVGRLNRVTLLQLEDTGITDAGLVHLEGLAFKSYCSTGRKWLTRAWNT